MITFYFQYILHAFSRHITLELLNLLHTLALPLHRHDFLPLIALRLWGFWCIIRSMNAMVSSRPQHKLSFSTLVLLKYASVKFSSTLIGVYTSEVRFLLDGSVVEFFWAPERMSITTVCADTLSAPTRIPNRRAGSWDRKKNTRCSCWNDDSSSDNGESETARCP